MVIVSIRPHFATAPCSSPATLISESQRYLVTWQAWHGLQCRTLADWVGNGTFCLVVLVVANPMDVAGSDMQNGPVGLPCSYAMQTKHLQAACTCNCNCTAKVRAGVSMRHGDKL